MSKIGYKKDEKDEIVKKDKIVADVINYSAENYSFDDFNDKIVKSGEYEMIKYGDNNQFPDEINQMYYNCARNSSIINNKIKFVQGAGFEIDTEDEKLKLKTEKFINDIDLYNIYKNVVCDMILYGGFGVSLVGNKLRDKYLPKNVKFGCLRANKMNEDEVVDTYFYNEKWKSQFDQKTTKILPAFDPTNAMSKEQLLYVYKKNPMSNYYPIPEYYSAKQIINLDIEINNYHLNNIKNGMKPSMKIIMNGAIPSEEERRQVREILNKEIIGSENAGKYILIFTETGQEVSIEPIQLNNSDTQFKDLSDMINLNILKGHSIPPILSSEITPGALGQRNEVITVYDFYYNTYICNEQQFILDSFINYLLELNKLAPVKIKKLELLQREYSIQELLLIYTPEEVKEYINKKINYEPIVNRTI